MKDIKWIDALKVRLGAGTTGNSAVEPYSTKGGVSSLYYNWGATASTLGYVASDPSAKASQAKMANPKSGMGENYTV